MCVVQIALVAALLCGVQGSIEMPSVGVCPGGSSLDPAMVTRCNTVNSTNDGCPVPKTNFFTFWGKLEEIADGICCISCLEGCEQPEGGNSLLPMIVYGVFILLMIIAFRTTFWAKINGSLDAAVAAAKNGPADLKKYAEAQKQAAQKAATGAVTGAVNQVKNDIKEEAKATAQEAAEELIEDGTGIDVSDVIDAPPRSSIEFDEDYFANLVVVPEIDPDEMCETFPEKVEEKLCANKTVKYWYNLVTKTIDICRKMSSEILVLVALTTVPPCQDGLKQLCGTQGMFSPCCYPITMFDVKRGVAVFGTVLKLGLSMYYMVKMAMNNGKPYYFPGSFSNDFFTVASGMKMKKAIPMSTTLSSGTQRKTVVVKNKKLKKDGGSKEVIAPRVSGIVKYQLYLLGVNLFLGFWLVILDNLGTIMSSGCSGDGDAVWVAIKAMMWAAILQAPELSMYYILFVVLCFEWCFVWYCWLVKICTFGVFQFRKFDDQDSDDFLKGMFTTRYSPPDDQNGLFKKIEKGYAVFYLWWYATIDTLPMPKPKNFYFLGPIPTIFPRFGGWIQQYNNVSTSTRGNHIKNPMREETE